MSEVVSDSYSKVEGLISRPLIPVLTQGTGEGGGGGLWRHVVTMEHNHWSTLESLTECWKYVHWYIEYSSSLIIILIVPVYYSSESKECSTDSRALMSSSHNLLDIGPTWICLYKRVITKIFHKFIYLNWSNEFYSFLQQRSSKL